MPPLVALERRSGHVRAAADGAERAPCDVIRFQAPEVVLGAGSLRAAGWVAQPVAQLAGAGLSATVWSGVTPNPEDHEVGRGRSRRTA